MKIGLVTDSTCDLPVDLLEKLNIEVVPLRVHFGTEKFIDGKEIDSAKFFNKIKTSSEMPKTSKPSKQAFLDQYTQMLKIFDNIISIHVSKGLSSTYDSAKLAARDIGEDKVKVIDSASISLGLGFQVLMTAKLIENNYSIKEILKRLKKTKEKVNCIFTVENLTYMKEGGRIGKARAFLGSIFNINPIIEISPITGKVKPLDKIRGNKKTLQKMSELIIEKIKDDKKAWVGILHGERPETAQQLLEKTKSLLPNDLDVQFFQERISPTLGCHVGPSVYAFATLSGEIINI